MENEVDDLFAELEDLARRAEVKAQSSKLATRRRELSERLKSAERRAQTAEVKFRDEGLAARRQIADAEEKEQKLKELTRKLAIHNSQIAPDAHPEEKVRLLQQRIETQRREARTKLEQLTRENAEARAELKVALEQYQLLEREFERLQADADRSNEEETLLKVAESYFLGSQIQSLSREIDDASRHFGFLDSRQQKAQLTIWIGRFRQLQERVESEEGEDVTEDQALMLERIFPTLVGLSKEHRPGYIEAFTKGFVADWDEYIENGRLQLQEATETADRQRRTESMLGERMAVDLEKINRLREDGLRALDELRRVVTSEGFPETGVEDFRAHLTRAIQGLGAGDPRILDAVRPFRELLTDGREFRALRRRLEKGESDVNGAAQADEEILNLTRGMRAVMIGGAVREENRRNVQSYFDFDELEWIPYEGHRPAAMGDVERRVRGGGLDVVLILKDFIAHHVTEKLRPLCEQHGVPCLLVDHGYGVGQIAEALRRGLNRIGTES